MDVLLILSNFKIDALVWALSAVKENFVLEWWFHFPPKKDMNFTIEQKSSLISK